MFVHTYAVIGLWMSGDNIQESVLSFHHEGSWDWIQVIKFGSKCLYLLRHLASLEHAFLRRCPGDGYTG